MQICVICGDNWDHTAIDPESRLLLSEIPGKRTTENCEKLIEDVKNRTGGRTDLLILQRQLANLAHAVEGSGFGVRNSGFPSPSRIPNPQPQQVSTPPTLN